MNFYGDFNYQKKGIVTRMKQDLAKCKIMPASMQNSALAKNSLPKTKFIQFVSKS